MHQQLGTKVDQRGRKAEAIVLGHATQIGCALARADGEADAQRRGQSLGQRRDIPAAFGGKHPVGRRTLYAHAITIVLDNLKVMFARHLDQRLAARHRCETGGRVMDFGRGAENLKIMVPRHLVQRFGDHAVFIHGHRNDIGAQQLARAAETGVRQLFNRDGGASALQDGLEHERQTVLPAVRQDHIGFGKGSQRRAGQPFDHGFAGGARPGAAGIMHHT